jgi:hypothetical protein
LDELTESITSLICDAGPGCHGKWDESTKLWDESTKMGNLPDRIRVSELE